MQALKSVTIVVCFTHSVFRLFVHKLNVFYLSVACSQNTFAFKSHCSVFKVQRSDFCFQKSDFNIHHCCWILKSNLCSVRMVGTSGLEPPTSRLSGGRSNQLSYEPIKSFIGGDKRDRTADLLLARQALSQLSYTPVYPHLFDGCECVPSKLNNVSFTRPISLTIGHIQPFSDWLFSLERR